MMTRRSLRGSAAGALVALLGCNADGAATLMDMAGSVAPPDLTSPEPPDKVAGLFVDRQYLPTGSDSGAVVERPRDLTGAVIELYAVDAAGVFKLPRTATGGSDGTFAFDQIPQGVRYSLRVGDRWIAGTTLRSHRLGDELLGRADGAPLVAPSVGLHVDVNNLNRFDLSDNFDLFSPTLNSGFDDLINNTTADSGLPQQGDTALLGAIFELKVLRPRALRFKDDAIFLTQRVRDTKGAILYANTPRVLGPLPLTISDAADAGSLSGAFTSVPLDQTFPSLPWQRSRFAAAAAVMHPSRTTLLRINMSLLATPGGYVRREWPYTPAVVAATSTNDLGALDSADTDTGALRYGAPYPSSWGLIGVAEMAVNFRLANNPDGAIKGAGSMVYLADLATFKSRPIAPLVTPVRNLQLDSRPAQSPQTAVGVVPVLTWQAPDTGAPDRYRVTLMQTRKGALYDLQVATFDTTETQLQVPPGVLAVGQPVYFIVRALQKVGPLTPGTPQGWADAFTDIITP